MRPTFIHAILASLLICIQGFSAPSQNERIILGDERFEEYVPLINGKRVAVFSNHTGIVGDKVTESGYGPHLVDVLIDKGISVRAIFSPEHGFRGTADAGEKVGSEVDEKTGVEIISLYGGGDALGKSNMDKFDILLVDIQDVGLRYYTYYISMLHLMEACARSGKEVIILDRPNPNGFYVDGPILDPEYKSGVGALPITTVHGMTLGELALMINGEGWLSDGLKCDLKVIPCLGYDHSMKPQLVVPPSPNLKTMRAIYLYASTCYFEGTIASLTDKGANVKLEGDDEGFAFSRDLIKEDGKQPIVGETLPFKVVELRRSTRRILLSHVRTYNDVKVAQVAAEADNTKKAVKKINSNLEKTTLGDIDALAALKEKLEKGE